MSTQSGLFVIREDGSLVGLSETAYDSEALLQELLAKYPALMAGDQIDPTAPRRWLLISRELGVPDEVAAANRWSLDHLFVDQEGIPTLVEVKRSTDTRIRREVVGQMLDYAANAVLHWPIETIMAAFERRCERESREPEQELQGFLGSGASSDAFWGSVKTNLQAGKIRLLFVSDEIPSELRRIVEFLNEQMDPAEVLAVEVRQYVGEGLKTMLPKVFGQTALAELKKPIGSTRRGRPWSEESFFAKLAEQGDESVTRVARALFDWGVRRGATIEYGEGSKMASFHIVWRPGGALFRPFGVYTNYTEASIEVPLGGSAMKAPPFDQPASKIELVERLNAIDGIQLPLDLNKRPSIYLTDIVVGDRLARFMKVMDWAVEAAGCMPPGSKGYTASNAVAGTAP